MMLRRTFLGLLLLVAPFVSKGLADELPSLSGAGATFPFPLFRAWAEAYRRKTGIFVGYDAIGSGSVVRLIQAGSVDFATSDIPLSPEELNGAGLFQFPVVVGGVVPVANLQGVAPGGLKLTGPILADIFAGRIERWNDPAIVHVNPGIFLPDRKIIVVHRGDASGTTFLLSHYLSEVSPAWRETIGAGSLIPWSAGIGAKGNEGVASLVANTPDAVGYVEYSYARRDGLSLLSLQNRDGAYLLPGRDAFQAAAINADWGAAPGDPVILANPPGDLSWPITGASFVLMRIHPDQPETTRQALAFFDWAYHEGQRITEENGYAALPDSVVSRIEQGWPADVQPPPAGH